MVGSCRSTLAAIAACAATARAILPRCHRGAACTSGCWNSRPCFGGLDPALIERNRAFSAPKSCIVLAGIMASRLRLPALARMRAPTVAPRITARFGAAASICAPRRSSMRRRRSCRPATWRASPCTASRSSSEISPPRLLSDTVASICTFASSNPASSKSFAARPSLLPASATAAYPATPSTRLPSSGKCRPYHSRMRESSRLAMRSTSSSDFIACMMCMSALLDASATLDEDSARAKSLRRDIASAWSDANPDSASIVGFDDCTASASPASIARQSISSVLLSAASSPGSLTDTTPSMPDRYSARPASPSRLPSLAARYPAAGSLNGNERACDAPSYTATPSSVSITLYTGLSPATAVKNHGGAACELKAPYAPLFPRTRHLLPARPHPAVLEGRREEAGACALGSVARGAGAGNGEGAGAGNGGRCHACHGPTGPGDSARQCRRVQAAWPGPAPSCLPAPCRRSPPGPAGRGA